MVEFINRLHVERDEESEEESEPEPDAPREPVARLDSRRTLCLTRGNSLTFQSASYTIWEFEDFGVQRLVCLE